jgi:hypothetical protein
VLVLDSFLQKNCHLIRNSLQMKTYFFSALKQQKEKEKVKKLIISYVTFRKEKDSTSWYTLYLLI